MDIWLTELEIEQLQQQLNPTHTPRVTHDANWELLRREQHSPRRYDTERAVKTQTPTLFDFGTHLGFSYRRWDGAAWHTELANLSEHTAFTTPQKEFIDTLNTLCAVTHTPRFEWLTPINEQQHYDPRYQIARQRGDYYCLIDQRLYKQSRTRERSDRGYREIGFSTRQQPTATLEQLNTMLDTALR